MLYFGKHFRYKYRSSSGPRQNGRMMSMRSFVPPSASSASLKKKKKLWERSLHSSGEAFWFIVNGTFQKLSGECHCCLRYIAFFFIASISCMLLTCTLQRSWIYKYNVLLLSQCCSLKSITRNIRASPPSWQVWKWSPLAIYYCHPKIINSLPSTQRKKGIYDASCNPTGKWVSLEV